MGVRIRNCRNELEVATVTLDKAQNLCFKTESTRKLSNFNFKWTKKASYQSNLKNIAFFFYIFQGLKV